MKNLRQLIPLFFCFFVMGFCDITGVAVSYTKTAFGLTETQAGLIPTMIFIWFLLISIPVATYMSRLGRKRTVQISNIITAVGMIIPFIHCNFATCMTAFVLLGIGNTILQVSLNPLIASMVSGKALSGTLNAGQVIKAISSFCGPFIAIFAAKILGNWMYIFPIFAAITIIASIWLAATPVSETGESEASIGATLALFKDKYILLLFFGIIAIVGVDVGTNTLTPKLLMERCGMAVEEAGLGSSVYFLCRTAGAFLGTALLAKMTDRRYMSIHICLAIAVVLLLMFTGSLIFPGSKIAILVEVGLVGALCSSIFAAIYSQALKHRPEKSNEISGIMITGVCGGAVVPPLMAWFSSLAGSQAGSVAAILCCLAYLAVCAFSLKRQ